MLCPATGRFGKPYNLAVCAAFGGLSKSQQFKDLKAGAEVGSSRAIACMQVCCPWFGLVGLDFSTVRLGICFLASPICLPAATPLCKTYPAVSPPGPAMAPPSVPLQVAVCTPGRMIDLVKMKACNMKRVTYLVFDEADRMFDMGFEPQVRSIMGQIRPDRCELAHRGICQPASRPVSLPACPPACS